MRVGIPISVKRNWIFLIIPLKIILQLIWPDFLTKENRVLFLYHLMWSAVACYHFPKRKQVSAYGSKIPTTNVETQNFASLHYYRMICGQQFLKIYYFV